MKKTLIAAAVVAVAVAAVPAITGWYVEKGAEDRLEAVLGVVPFLTVAERSYHRGWFSSDETVTFELLKGVKLPPAPAPGSAPTATAAAQPLRVSVHNHIVHGPIPGFTVGLARIDTTFASATKAAPPPAADGAPVPTFETVLGLFGGGRTTVSSRAVNNALGSDQSHYSADATSLVIDFGKNLDTLDAVWKVPHLLVRPPTGAAFEITAFSATLHQHRVLRSLYAGEAEATLGGFEAVDLPTPAGPQSLALQMLHFKSQTAVEGGYVNSGTVLTLAALKAAGKAIHAIKADMTIDHWQADALERLSAGYRAMAREPATPDAKLAEMVKLWKSAGTDLAVHDPSMTIRDLEFLAPDGFARLSGSVRITGATAEDFKMPMNPGVLLSKLRVEFDILVDESLAAAWTPKPPTTPGPATRGRARPVAPPVDPIAALVAQGYLAHDGTRLRSKILFANGALTVNGKPYAPGGPGVPPRTTR